jgi:hypothetical protein
VVSGPKAGPLVYSSAGSRVVSSPTLKRYGDLIQLKTTRVPDRDIIAGPDKVWIFGSSAMGKKSGVPSRCLRVGELHPEHVASGQISYQIEIKRGHARHPLYCPRVRLP